MFVSLQSSTVETLIPGVLIFSDGVFGRLLGLDEVIRVEPSGWD